MNQAWSKGLSEAHTYLVKHGTAIFMFGAAGGAAIAAILELNAILYPFGALYVMAGCGIVAIGVTLHQTILEAPPIIGGSAGFKQPWTPPAVRVIEISPGLDRLVKSQDRFRIEVSARALIVALNAKHQVAQERASEQLIFALHEAKLID